MPLHSLDTGYYTNHLTNIVGQSMLVHILGIVYHTMDLLCIVDCNTQLHNLGIQNHTKDLLNIVGHGTQLHNQDKMVRKVGLIHKGQSVLMYSLHLMSHHELVVHNNQPKILHHLQQIVFLNYQSFLNLKANKELLFLKILSNQIAY